MAELLKQAVAGGEANGQCQDGRDPARERRERARATSERMEIAPEIGFLGAHGVGPGILLQAMRIADRCRSSADAALLGEGLVSLDFYYRALARQLRVPFFDGELAIDESVDPAKAIVNGIAPLKHNGLHMRAAVAPRGASIRYLLAAAAEGRPLSGLVVTSPPRLAAIVRAQAGAKVAESAASDLERRDCELSAHSGLSWRQIGGAAAVVVAVAVSAWVAPGALAVPGAALLWLTFGAWVVVRNLAVAAADGGPARGSLPDEDLPVYSIVAPLYREANMVAKLVKAFDALDYPGIM